MSPKSLVFLSVVLLAGVLGATAAYRIIVPASSTESAPRESLVVDAADQGAANKQTRRQGFAPCRKPARLEGGQCVTEEVRTVTVPGTSAVTAARPPASAPAPAPAPTTAPSGTDDDGDDDGHHHGGDDDGHHHGGDGEDGHHHGGDDDDDDSHHGGDDDDHDDDSGHHGGDDDDRDDDDDRHGEDD